MQKLCPKQNKREREREKEEGGGDLHSMLEALQLPTNRFQASRPQ